MAAASRQLPYRPAFTLIELLVVVAIIVILIAILMPALGKAKWQAKLTVCGSQVRQFAVAMNTYAHEENGWLPRHDFPYTGTNLLDVANEFYDVMHKTYNIPDKVFLCPMIPPDSVDMHSYGFFVRIGYSLWIPRLDGGVMIQPERGDASFTFGPGTDAVRGPKRLIDDIATTNPILTDVVATYDQTLPEGANVSPGSQHDWGGRIERANEAYADGHVEQVSVNKLQLKYFGNRWNWR